MVMVGMVVIFMAMMTMMLLVMLMSHLYVDISEIGPGRI